MCRPSLCRPTERFSMRTWQNSTMNHHRSTRAVLSTTGLQFPTKDAWSGHSKYSSNGGVPAQLPVVHALVFSLALIDTSNCQHIIPALGSLYLLSPLSIFLITCHQLRSRRSDHLLSIRTLPTCCKPPFVLTPWVSAVIFAFSRASTSMFAT